MTSRKEEKERLRQERVDAQAREDAEARKRLVLGYIVAALLAGAVVAGIVFAVSSGGEDSGAPTTATTPEGEEINLDDFPEVRTDVGVLPDGVTIDTREGTAPAEISTGDLAASADAAGCVLETEIEEEDGEATHYGDEQRMGEDWNTNPPTSGDHYGVPTEAGSGALADGPFLTPAPISRVLHSLEHGRVSIQYSPDLSEEEQLILKGVYDADSAGNQLFPNPELDGELAVAAWNNLLTCKDFDAEAGPDAIRNFILQFRGQGPEDFPF